MTNMIIFYPESLKFIVVENAPNSIRGNKNLPRLALQFNFNAKTYGFSTSALKGNIH